MDARLVHICIRGSAQRDSKILGLASAVRAARASIGVVGGNKRQFSAGTFKASPTATLRPVSAQLTSPSCSRQHSRLGLGVISISRRRQYHHTSTTMGRSLQGPQPQAIDAPLTKSATFLVLTVNATSPGAIKTVRSTLAGIDGLAKNVSLRDLGCLFACTAGIGSDIWDALTGLPRPAELHPFREVKGAIHTAVSTPGDLLFHIRSDRRDICFEFERQLMNLLGDSVTVVDTTEGFRYFDARDLLGFVDGTANPVGASVPASVLVAEEQDPSSVGGSYVVVQKYVHDVKAWSRLSTERQESIIGRTKLDNMELDDAPAPDQKSHKTLATIEDEDTGEEHDILRDNMPFGSPSSDVFGTYFIGYSRRLWVTERMLERMFVGSPPGLHDRILDYSRPLTGTTFFAPSASVLAHLDD